MNNPRIIAIYGLSLMLCMAMVTCTKRKNAAELRPELVGEWQFKSLTSDKGADLKISEAGLGDYVSFEGARTKSASAPATLKANTLKIGAFRLEINSFPQDQEIARGQFNKFMIIDGDTFFKKPKLKIDRCANGIKDGDETEIDCGGRCPTCFTTSCGNELQENTIVITDCQYPPYYPDYEIFEDVTKLNVAGYELKGVANSSTLAIRFASMPVTSRFFQISEVPVLTIPGNDIAVVTLHYYYKNQLYSEVLTGGKLLVTVDEEFFTITLCKHEVAFIGLGCMLVSAKIFAWKL